MKIELVMVREGPRLRPHGDPAWDAFESIPGGAKVMVTVTQPRNPDHHNKLWAIASRVANFHEDFLDAEDAIEYVKLLTPSMRKEYTLQSGRIVIRTKSISFAAMDQIKFNAFYDNALSLWAKKIGCDPETLLVAKEKVQGRTI